MIRDLFHEIYSSLRQNKLRTALTGFAVSWGIFLLICLLGAGNGLMNSFMGNMEDFLTQTMHVEAWRTSKPYHGYKEGRVVKLDESDVALTKSPMWADHIDQVTQQTAATSVTLSSGQQTAAASVTGVTPEYQGMEKVQMQYGRFLNPTDLTEKRKVAVIGNRTAMALSYGRPESMLGTWVRAGNISLQIVGIYQTDETSMSRRVYIPYSTYKAIYNADDKVEVIAFTFHGLETLEENKAFEKEYGDVLRARHDIAPDDERGLWIWNRYTGNLEMTKAQNIIRIALWILGLLTLVSGIVGVSNIMLITVKERTHEFGIRKALGARPMDIMKLIIAESVTITALFGYLGMFLGMIACEIMDKTIGAQAVDLGFTQIRMLVNPTVGLGTAITATLVLIVAGTIAGAVPARNATHVKPIEALRAE